jgi:hemerythrin superfamily protein
MANILKQLSDEHDEVAKLLDTLTEEDGDRAACFEELFRKLMAHSRAEEEEFYSHVRTLDEGIASLIEDAFQEHQEVEKLLEQLKVTSDSDKFASLLEDLSERVEHHIEEEEGELFPLIEQHLSEEELADLNRRYLETKRTVLETSEAARGGLHHDAHVAH